MFNSHIVRHKISINVSFITIHHESFTDTLDIFGDSGVISGRVCGPKLPVSTLKNEHYEVTVVMKICFSDYDLSLICISKCDEAYLECASNCSSSDCLTECNRAFITCSDGKFSAHYNMLTVHMYTVY